MRVAVLGGGPGGYVAALRAAMLGAEVTVVEKGPLGGTCLNAGCIPTKAMLASAGVLDAAREAGRMGVCLSGEAELDLPAVMVRKDKVVKQLAQGIEMLFAARGVKRLEGTGALEPDGRLAVTLANGGRAEVDYDRLILATGSLPVVPQLFPFDGKKIITSDEALCLETAPASLIIVGGGVIGCELGQFYARCGTSVTIVEALPRLLPNEDPEIHAALSRSFRKSRVALQTGARVTGCQAGPREVRIELEGGKTLSAEKLLVCIGRRPNLQGLALEELGIQTRKGKIVTDAGMETTRRGVYAIGDIVEGPMLAHAASREGMVAVERICLGEGEMSFRAVPRCVYTTPEVACVGQTEEERKESGLPYRAGVCQFAGLGKAKAAGKTDGFVKVLVDERDVLIGAAIVGEHATELLGELTLAVELGLTAKQLGGVIHPHPTMSEAIMEALHQVHGCCVHGV